MAIISGRISKEEIMIPYQKEKIENDLQPTDPILRLFKDHPDGPSCEL
jgi:hypothetical protein